MITVISASALMKMHIDTKVKSIDLDFPDRSSIDNITLKDFEIIDGALHCRVVARYPPGWDRIVTTTANAIKLVKTDGSGDITYYEMSEFMLTFVSELIHAALEKKE